MATVTCHEIRNVFVEAIRKLDKEIMPEKGSIHRDAILKHFETIQYELYKRAGMPGGPKVKRPEKDAPDSREALEAMRQRIRGNK